MRKLGMNGGSFRGVNALDSIPLIKGAGFDSFFTGYRDDEYTGQMAECAAKQGLTYDFVHAPFKGINNIWLPGEDGEVMLKQLIDCAESCKRYDIPAIVVHLSSGDDAPCINDIGHERWDRLVYRAGELGVNIAFENQRKLANLAFVMEIYKELKHVGFCWDNGHEGCFTPGREFMPLFGDRLMALHVHDNMNRYNEDIHLLPFDGVLDFHRFAELVRGSGYTGTMMLEVLPKKTDLYDHMTVEQYYAAAYETAVRLRYMVDGE